MKKFKTVGLYGKNKPRIEYRIIEEGKDVTDNYDLFSELTDLLENLKHTFSQIPQFKNQTVNRDCCTICGKNFRNDCHKEISS
jgi:hypothetical protein